MVVEKNIYISMLLHSLAKLFMFFESKQSFSGERRTFVEERKNTEIYFFPPVSFFFFFFLTYRPVFEPLH